MLRKLNERKFSCTDIIHLSNLPTWVATYMKMTHCAFRALNNTIKFIKHIFIEHLSSAINLSSANTAEGVIWIWIYCFELRHWLTLLIIGIQILFYLKLTLRISEMLSGCLPNSDLPVIRHIQVDVSDHLDTGRKWMPVSGSSMIIRHKVWFFSYVLQGLNSPYLVQPLVKTLTISNDLKHQEVVPVLMG